jgi:hypothetical protein
MGRRYFNNCGADKMATGQFWWEVVINQRPSPERGPTLQGQTAGRLLAVIIHFRPVVQAKHR